eukprot:GHVQ01008279.1.p1 GENE.GHVQ01008279.1~~GHVQ01008279.1.p1  ORF type:complete len:411 (+),score=125.77 GHVQ01008279.1:241-1473(+)
MFHSIQVKGGSQEELTHEDATLFHLSHACLSSESSIGGDPCELRVKYAGGDFIIARLQRGKIENVRFDLFFNLEDRRGPFFFSCQGEEDICLTGYFEPPLPEEDEDDDGSDLISMEGSEEPSDNESIVESGDAMEGVKGEDRRFAGEEESTEDERQLTDGTAEGSEIEEDDEVDEEDEKEMRDDDNKQEKGNALEEKKGDVVSVFDVLSKYNDKNLDQSVAGCNKSKKVIAVDGLEDPTEDSNEELDEDSQLCVGSSDEDGSELNDMSDADDGEGGLFGNDSEEVEEDEEAEEEREEGAGGKNRGKKRSSNDEDQEEEESDLDMSAVGEMEGLDSSEEDESEDSQHDHSIEDLMDLEAEESDRPESEQDECIEPKSSSTKNLHDTTSRRGGRGGRMQQRGGGRGNKRGRI